jgi:hypothetical protein
MGVYVSRPLWSRTVPASVLQGLVKQGGILGGSELTKREVESQILITLKTDVDLLDAPKRTHRFADAVGRIGNIAAVGIQRSPIRGRDRHCCFAEF